LVDLQRMAYPHKWSPISCKSSAGQRKDTGQRPMLYTAGLRNQVFMDKEELVAYIYVAYVVLTYCRRRLGRVSNFNFCSGRVVQVGHVDGI